MGNYGINRRHQCGMGALWIMAHAGKCNLHLGGIVRALFGPHVDEKRIVLTWTPTKNPARRDFLSHNLLVAVILSWRPIFGPAIAAIDWPVRSWLKWQFGDFFSAITAFPVSLNHLSWPKISSAFVIKFIEHLCIVDFYSFFEKYTLSTIENNTTTFLCTCFEGTRLRRKAVLLLYDLLSDRIVLFALQHVNTLIFYGLLIMMKP